MNKTSNTTQRARPEIVYKWKGTSRKNLPLKYRNKLLPLFTKYALRKRAFKKDQSEKKENTPFRLSEKELEEAYTKAELYFITRKRFRVSQLFNEFYCTEFLPGLVEKARKEKERIDQEERRRLRERETEKKIIKQQEKIENMAKKRFRAERRRAMELKRKLR